VIYFYHIPKVGGTSVNMMFLSLGGHDGDAVYTQLIKDSPNHTVCLSGRIFMAWNMKLIPEADYFYAFSHSSYKSGLLPPETFTFTLLRNPEDRVLSHYKELLAYERFDIDHPARGKDGRWLGNSFEDYLSNAPVGFFHGQTYIFSRKGSVNEAEDIIRSLSFYFFTEQFSLGVERLAQLLDLPLKERHDRKALLQFTPSERERAMLEEKVALDWDLYRRLHTCK
jgi:hypothetical protein